MIKLENYLIYLQEVDLKKAAIHPKRKSAMSVTAMANPFDDAAAIGLGMWAGSKKPEEVKAKIGALTKKHPNLGKAATGLNKYLDFQKGAENAVFNKVGKVIKNPETLKKIETPTKMAAGAAIGLTIGTGGVLAYREIRSWFDKCTKQCGTFEINTPKRQLCMLKCKQIANKKKEELSNKGKENQAERDKKIQLYQQYLKKNKK